MNRAGYHVLKKYYIFLLFHVFMDWYAMTTNSADRSSERDLCRDVDLNQKVLLTLSFLGY